MFLLHSSISTIANTSASSFITAIYQHCALDRKYIQCPMGLVYKGVKLLSHGHVPLRQKPELTKYLSMTFVLEMKQSTCSLLSEIFLLVELRYQLKEKLLKRRRKLFR